MITLTPADSKHKAFMYRLLGAMLDEPTIANHLIFKGGTCAAMSGFLDRFSVDLDFDLTASENKDELRADLHKLFPTVGLTLDQESQHALQFFLKYGADANQRNTLKLEITDFVFSSSKTEMRHLPDVQRIVRCQTRETMMAHKLVAITDRFEKNQTIAGRDLYDIHHFLIQGYSYDPAVIEERTGLSALEYLQKLSSFIEQKITHTIIDQDINYLVPYDKFQVIRRVLKSETLLLIGDEIKRFSN